MPDLLLELFSEEIPARMQARAAGDLHRLVLAGLGDVGLGEGEASASYATPRRLSVVVSGLKDKTDETETEIKGPRVGAPEQAIGGFLKSRGLASVDQLQVSGKGSSQFYVHVERKESRPTIELLPGIIERALATLPWPKSMRWGVGTTAWVRPLQGIVCLFDGKVVPVAFAGVTAGDATRGHRFLAPGVFEVRGFEDYRTKLRAAKVILDAGERKALILERARALAGAEGMTPIEDEGLAEENAGLTEWPVVHLGRFDPAYLALPPEVLAATMRSHQKYFALKGADGRLANRFVLVANTETDDGGAAVVAGNERVLRARLADARFFWDQDRKRRLESRVPDLDGIVYHARLGTLGQRVARLERLAADIATFVADCDVVQARRAARLAKADLTTGMVGEFPELQGVMGRYYAIHDGEPEAVATAIAEHYAPAGPADRCPTAPVSVAVALADKIDALAGFFAVGEKPTGSKDPFALRRAALGLIRLQLENGVRFGLLDLATTAVRLYAPTVEASADKVAAELLDFLADRLKVHLRESGVRHDTIGAVFAKGDDDLVRIVARARALQGFLASPDGGNLLTAYRRAGNIVRIETKRDGRRYDGTSDPAKFAAPEEKALNHGLDRVSEATARALAAEAFEDAMRTMATLRPSIDAFFDRVTVNTEDRELRENRLRLLARIQATLDSVADFTKIEG